MRRRYKKKYLLLKFFLFFILFSTIIGVSYSLLQQSLNISGNVKGNYISENYTITPDSNPSLEITSFSANRWKESGLEKTQYRFTVTNKSNKRVTNFRMIIDFNNSINNVNILNYEYTLSSNILTVINNNYVLQPGGQQEVSFTVATTSPTLRIRTIRFVVNEIPGETDPSLFTVVFTKTSESGTYNYQYLVTVTNKTGNRVDFWQLDIILPSGTTFLNGSNATFQASGNTLLVICSGSNCRVTNNKSTSFNLQLKTDIINFIPSNIKVTVR